MLASTERLNRLYSSKDIWLQRIFSYLVSSFVIRPSLTASTQCAVQELQNQTRAKRPSCFHYPVLVPYLIMDPLTITATCFGPTITQTSIAITGFVREVRGARSDPDAVSRKLLSLKTVLELLTRRRCCRQYHWDRNLAGGAQ